MALSAEYVRSRVAYDPETGRLSWKSIAVRDRIDRMWNTRFAGTSITHKNSSGHIQFGLDGKNVLGHRIAWLITHGECPSLIDHENGVRDDNRLCNLRPASSSQNASNSKDRSHNTSGYRGVWRQNGKWLARIGSERKKIYLGSFDTAESAAAAYNAAATNLHGEFARLNDIGGYHR